MLGNFSDIPEAGLTCDVAIAGGGAAGLTLARTLAAGGLNVVLLEAGGDKKTDASQELYRGELVDPVVHPATHNYRVRALGGTSRIWGGRAIPLDPIDLEERAWVPGSGWPLSFAELARDYAEALEAAEAGEPAYSAAEALPGAQEELAPGLDGEMVRTTVERFSKPTNFWRRYGAELAQSKQATVFRDAPVTRVQLTDDGGSVAWLEVAGTGRRAQAGDGKELRAGARRPGDDKAAAGVERCQAGRHRQ